VVTASVPTSTSVPLLVKLDNVKLNPLNVSAAPLLIVKLEIVTFAVSAGMLVAVLTINAESCDAGVPRSQL